MFSPVWNYFKGYVIIKVSGLSKGKLVNMMSFYGIDVWDVCTDDKALYLKASAINKKKITETAQKCRCRAEVIGYGGLADIINKIKNRYTYFCGLFLFCVVVYVLSLFIWDIKIAGTYNTETKSVEDFISRSGIYAGRLKKDINTAAAAKLVENEFDDIGWASSRIDGSVFYIDIAEKIDKADAGDSSIYCDIISDKDAIIESIAIIKGKALKKAGDVVKKGDIIVQGIMEFKENDEVMGFDYINAEAYIRAKTKFTEEFEINGIKEVKEYTGSESKSIVFGYKDNIKEIFFEDFENYYKTEIFEMSLNLGKYKVPFFIKVYDLKEYETKVETLEQREIDENIRTRLDEIWESNFSTEAYIISEDIKTEIKDNKICVKAEWILSQKIGVLRKFEEEENLNIRGETY